MFRARCQRYIPDHFRHFRGAVELTVNAIFKRPENHYRRKIRRPEMLTTQAPYAHHEKPDGDNVLKFINDSLKGLAFHDDAQISDMSIKKRWNHEAAYVEISIRQFKQEGKK